MDYVFLIRLKIYMYNTAKKMNNSNIVLVKAVSYFEENLDEYIMSFNSYKKYGIITESSLFESKVWKVYDEVIHVSLIFDLNEIEFEIQNKKKRFTFTYKELISAMKCFIILLLNKNKLSTIKGYFSCMKKIINESHYFDDEYIKAFRKKVKVSYSKYSMLQVYGILNFIEYFGKFAINNEFYNLIDEEIIKKQEKDSRLLPNYESMFKFADIMENFIKNETYIVEKFYIIVLWWYITAIIPLRTTEFCLIPYDCVNEIDGEYNLKLRRCATKGYKDGYIVHSIEGSYYEDIIVINKKIYDIITKYKTLVDKYDDYKDFYGNGRVGKGQRKFLISYRNFYNSLSNIAKGICKNRFYLDYFNPTNLCSLLNCFYSEVVSMNYTVISKYNLIDECVEKIGEEKKIMNYEIEKFQPMDTRHYAIMSMVLQKYPLVKIKELAGHRNIQTTYGYACQIDKYIECYTYYLAKGLIQNENNNVKLFDSNFLESPIQKTLYFLEKIRSGDIMAEECNKKRGWCIYCHFHLNDEKNIPCNEHDYNCERGCKYYVSKSKNGYEISQVLIDNNDKVETSIRVIREILQDSKKIKEFEMMYRTEITRLEAYTRQNARIIKEHFQNSI